MSQPGKEAIKPMRAGPSKAQNPLPQNHGQNTSSLGLNPRIQLFHQGLSFGQTLSQCAIPQVLSVDASSCGMHPQTAVDSQTSRQQNTRKFVDHTPATVITKEPTNEASIPSESNGMPERDNATHTVVRVQTNENRDQNTEISAIAVTQNPVQQDISVKATSAARTGNSDPSTEAQTTVPQLETPEVPDFVKDASLAFLPVDLRVPVGMIRMNADIECSNIASLSEKTNSENLKENYQKRIRGVKQRAAKQELKAIKSYGYRGQQQQPNSTAAATRETNKPVNASNTQPKGPAKPVLTRPANTPIERPIEKPIQGPIKKSVERPIQRPVQKPIEKPIENSFKPGPRTPRIIEETLEVESVQKPVHSIDEVIEESDDDILIISETPVKKPNPQPEKATELTEHEEIMMIDETLQDVNVHHPQHSTAEAPKIESQHPQKPQPLHQLQHPQSLQEPLESSAHPVQPVQPVQPMVIEETFQEAIDVEEAALEPQSHSPQPVKPHVIPPVVMPIKIQPPVQPLKKKPISPESPSTPNNTKKQSTKTIHVSPTPPNKKRKVTNFSPNDNKPICSELHIPETQIPVNELQPSTNEHYIAETEPVLPRLAENNPRSLYSNIHEDPSYTCRDLIHPQQRPKRLTASQRDIIQTLYRTGNYSRVSPLDRYLQLQLPMIPSSVFDEIEPKLAGYIVCIPRQVPQEPAEMMKTNRFLFSGKSQEEILHKVYMKNTKTQNFRCHTGAEFYNGPWMELLGIIGTEWVVYLMVCARMLKHFNDSTLWLHLWGPEETQIAPVKPQLRIEFPSLSTYALSSIQTQSVSKNSIMYQRKNYKFQYKPTAEEDRELHPLVLAKVQQIRPKLEFLNPVVQEYPDFVPLTNVMKHLTNVLTRVRLQKGTFGSVRNVSNLNHNILVYLKRPRAHKVPVRFFIRGLKTTEISWLANSGLDNPTQQKVLLQLTLWAVNKVVNPLLVHLFYITERSGMPLTVYYYDRLNWSRIQAKEMQLHNLNQVNETEESSEKGEPWRLVPKPDGSTRVIVNLKAKNKELEDAHAVLQSLLTTHKGKFASASNWLARVLEFREKFALQGWGKSGMPFYVVKFDISSCYESADIGKVKQLALRLLNNGENSYLSSSMLQFLAKQQKYAKRRDLAGEDDEIQKILTQLKTENEGRKQKLKGKSIVLTEKNSRIVSGSAILAKIDDLLDNLRVQVKHGVSVPFRNGIPQGSACSSELCDMLLTDLIKTKLGYTECERGLLVRYVDDFLFVTIDLKLATQVFEDCQRGFKEYNLYCKPAKVLRSFGAKSVSRIKFLGVELNCDDLSPCCLQLPVFLTTEKFSKETTKAKIVQELNATAVLLKAYTQACLQIPNRVILNTAFVFGRVLGRRISVLVDLAGENAEIVYKKALDKYILRHIPVKDQTAEMHNQLRSGFLKSSSK